VKHPTYSVNACDRSVLLTGAANGGTLRPVVDQPPRFALAPGYEPGTQFPLEIVAARPELGVLAGVFGLDLTSDQGRTWREDDYPCRPPYVTTGWPAGSVALDSSGSLWLACAGEPTAGFQPKQLWRSFDDGRSFDRRWRDLVLGAAARLSGSPPRHPQTAWSGHRILPVE